MTVHGAQRLCAGFYNGDNPRLVAREPRDVFLGDVGEHQHAHRRERGDEGEHEPEHDDH